MKTLFCIRPKGFNVGNEAIFMALQHFLYEAFGEVVNLIALPATARYESTTQAGLTARTVYEINQYGHGVILGGGNLYENGELDLSLEALEALEVPLLLFSLSRGRVYNRHHRLVDRTDAMPRPLVRSLNRKASYSLVRDTATQEYLLSIGCEQARLGGCPSLFLNRFEERLPSLSGRDTAGVLVSVRNPSLMSIPLRDRARVADDIRRIIHVLRGNGYQDVRLLCHDHRDISFASTFTDIDYVYTGDIYVFLAMLRDAELVVSYRLHASLPCLAFETPFISISYDERGRSGLETMGPLSWDIHMLTEDLQSEFQDRLSRLDELPELCKAAQSRWQELSSTMRNTLRSFAEDVRANEDHGAAGSS